MKFLFCIVVIATLAFANAERCIVPCTREYRPVCGSDGQQHNLFPNLCALNNQHCKDGNTWFQTRAEECKENINLEEEENCVVPCTREYRPVCGTDGEHFKIFPNPCVLKNQHCKDGKNWFQTRTNSCHNGKQLTATDDCPTFCPAIYVPVCGFDGQTYKVFTSKCMLDAESCRLHKNWSQTRLENCGQNFEEKTVDNCRKFCPDVYAPVCGFDGMHYKVFANECLMNVSRCRDHKGWTVQIFSNCRPF